MAFDSIMTIPKVTPVSRPDVSALGVSSRSQIVLLQSLVSIVLCYQILFSHDGLLAREVQEILILGLLLLVAGAIVLPIRLVESRSFTIMLLLIDTTVTSSPTLASIFEARSRPISTGAGSPSSRSQWVWTSAGIALVDRRGQFRAVLRDDAYPRGLYPGPRPAQPVRRLGA